MSVTGNAHGTAVGTHRGAAGFRPEHQTGCMSPQFQAARNGGDASPHIGDAPHTTTVRDAAAAGPSPLIVHPRARRAAWKDCRFGVQHLTLPVPDHIGRRRFCTTDGCRPRSDGHGLRDRLVGSASAVSPAVAAAPGQLDPLAATGRDPAGNPKPADRLAGPATVADPGVQFGDVRVGVGFGRPPVPPGELAGDHGQGIDLITGDGRHPIPNGSDSGHRYDCSSAFSSASGAATTAASGIRAGAWRRR